MDACPPRRRLPPQPFASVPSRSGPLATIIHDVLSLAVYFLTVSLVAKP